MKVEERKKYISNDHHPIFLLFNDVYDILLSIALAKKKKFTICQYENIIIAVATGRSSGTLIHEYAYFFQLHAIQLVSTKRKGDRERAREKKKH